MEKKISFAGPWITNKEVEYVLDAVKNGWYDSYDMHADRLKKAVADYLGVKYVIPTHCCTLALHLASSALGLQKGDEVICTDFSWVATAYAIAYTGATPVFVDIDPDSWCISPDAIKKAITPKTKAIMIVHCFGHPAQMDRIMDIARRNSLKVIEDAAPSLGSKFKRQRTGTFGDCACFSFQGAKIAVSGEGGVFVTNNEEIYKKALLFSEMGRTDSKAVFWSDMIGYQYTIGNLTAALALAQVERIEELVAKKRQIFEWYHQRLDNVPRLKIMREKADCRSNYCYPSILLDDRISRDVVVKKLKEKNIHSRPTFPRMSRFPVFEQRFENPVAEKVERSGISLPSAANLVEDDIERVCRSIIEMLS